MINKKRRDVVIIATIFIVAGIVMIVFGNSVIKNPGLGSSVTMGWVAKASGWLFIFMAIRGFVKNLPHV